MTTSTTVRFAVSLLMAVALPAAAQTPGDANSPDSSPELAKQPEEIVYQHESFTFVRIQYGGAVGRRSTGNSWSTDYPDADFNFASRFQEVTGLRSNTNGLVMKLTDPQLNEQPFIYFVEGGQLQLTEAEVPLLRDYLLGGGFLMVDDFWGEAEWGSLARELQRVFPDRQPVELPLDHEVFNCFYAIPEKPQVPNVAMGVESRLTGITWERDDAKEPHYRGLLDDTGRLMAIFCHNTDLGDGWERADVDPYYFQEFSLKKAYPMGINIVVYALTH